MGKGDAANTKATTTQTTTTTTNTSINQVGTSGLTGGDAVALAQTLGNALNAGQQSLALQQRDYLAYATAGLGVLATSNAAAGTGQLVSTGIGEDGSLTTSTDTAGTRTTSNVMPWLALGGVLLFLAYSPKA